MVLNSVCKVDKISERKIYQQNCYLFFFLKVYFVMRLKVAFMRNLLKCNMNSYRNHALLQPFCKVNVAIVGNV